MWDNALATAYRSMRHENGSNIAKSTHFGISLETAQGRSQEMNKKYKHQMLSQPFLSGMWQEMLERMQ
jgi:hypothetical protein